ncbi:[Pyruvate dehydrogenase (acetyl-transferring)] kinase isozyme 2 [Basidiobolus ranarum]|uniref:Protein-serine/threonine kinase n=1 Tax=Basidiobolus ranarum TaxID=34480 RepID=A0ABR2VUW8_9FUNG
MNATVCLKALNRGLLTRLATTPVNRVSVQQMYAMERFSPASSLLVSLFCRDVTEASDRAKILAPMEFLHAELPVRLCQNFNLLNTRLRSDWADHQVNTKVHQLTLNLLEDIDVLAGFPVPTKPHDVASFISALKVLQVRQNQNYTSLRECLSQVTSRQLRSGQPQRPLIHENMNDVLMDYFSLNYGTNWLIAQSINQYNGFQCVLNEVSPHSAAEQAIQTARQWCSQYYSCEPPEVKLISKKTNIEVIATNHSIQDSLFQVLKHSIGSVIEHSQTLRTRASDMPPLEVRMTEGEEDICFRVSDLGGGIPMSSMSNIWDQLSNSTEKTKGLSMTRSISRYFGGDLEIVSMEGNGTESYLYLDRTGTIGECIPSVSITDEEVDSLVDTLYYEKSKEEVVRVYSNETCTERVAVTA